METCYAECRTNHFVSLSSSSTTTMDNSTELDGVFTDSAVQLRDCIVRLELDTVTRIEQSQSTSENIDTKLILLYRQGCVLLMLYVHRLKEQAKVVATYNNNKQTKTIPTVSSHDKYKLWSSLAEFVIPIIESLQKKVSIDTQSATQDIISVFTLMPQPAIELIELSCIELISAEWMVCNNSTSRFIEPTLLQLLVTIVPILLQQRKQQHDQLVQDQIKQNFVSSTRNNNNNNVILIKRITAALDSIRSWIALQQSSVNTPVIIRLVSDTATHRTIDKWNDDNCDTLAAEFGFAYLEFLICWSGFNTTSWTFCTLPEARMILIRARQCLCNSTIHWGRVHNDVDDALVNLAQADIEGGYFDGGLSSIGITKYLTTVQIANNLNDNLVRDILIARCCCGLNKIKNKNPYMTFDTIPPEYDAHMSLNILRNISTDSLNTIQLSLWTSHDFVKGSIRFQLAASRQLIAESMLRQGNVTDALQYLDDAFIVAPDDAGIALSLGSLRLYLCFFGSDDSMTPESKRTAQIQLMKAAKLDSTRASPFALLGYWYESANDMNRAIGCYTKALALDPAHPVAGRGILRLVTPFESVRSILDRSTNIASASNGWAWRAIGRYKCIVDGDDEIGLVALQKALRCKDIEQQDYDSFSSAFFSSPDNPQLPSRQEVVTILTDIACSYRRLGRFTAAIRSFHIALEESGDQPSCFLLCQCALVELELGLYEDAEEKFALALQLNVDTLSTIATLGRGEALMALAKRDLEDNKLGSSFQFIRQAIELCEKVDTYQTSGCIQKLLGDLYTLASFLPSELFGTKLENLVELHCHFIEKGEAAYAKAENCTFLRSVDHVASNELKASFITDRGNNLLLRAQLLSRLESNSLHSQRSPETDKLYKAAEREFRRAIDVFPTFALAWCGLGCSVIATDPLLAQHAFCRSLELDMHSQDSYANLGFLCTTHESLSASEELCEALTEVADTPMMWLNRALIIEEKSMSSSNPTEYTNWKIRASDAYRASLQVSRHPVGVLGLAMTCRILKNEKNTDVSIRQKLSAENECLFLLAEFLNLFGRTDPLSSLYEGVMEAEVGLDHQVSRSSYSNEIVSIGRDKVHASAQQLLLPSRGADDKLGGMLESSRILKLLESLENVTRNSNSGCMSLEHSKSYSSTNVLELSRQIINEPNNGLLWVKLAKGYATQAIIDVSNQSQNTDLSAAKISSSRAVNILTSQLLAKRTNRTVSLMRSIDLADAFALRFWTNRLENEIPLREKNNLDLQRALMIDPTNQLARNALRIEANNNKL